MAKRILLIVALVLGGCQSNPGHFDRSGRERERAGQEVSDDCKRRLEDPAIDPIRAKIVVELDGKVTPKMQSDASKPTMAEKGAILAYAVRREECARRGFDWLKKSYAAMDLVVAEAQHAENRLLLADLYGGKLSYGDFAARRQALLADGRARRVELERLIAEGSAESRKGAQRIADNYKRTADHDTQAALERNRRNMEWMRLYKAVSK